jgi:hypothetical protein
MSLSDPEVAALARQAVDLLDPGIEIRIEPEAAHDPYGFGSRAWRVSPLIDGPANPGFAIVVYSNMTPVQALARLIDGLDNASESDRFWGKAFPACPGHAHDAHVVEEADADGDVVLLRCPSTGEIVDRIRPAI